MTSCHDPYKELELYLEQAQEEIGKAVRELEHHENENDNANESPTVLPWVDPPDNFLPPPEAFRSASSHKNAEIYRFSSSGVNEMCQDKNVDVQTSLNRAFIADSLYSSSASFLSSLNTRSLGRFKKPNYSPNTRRRLWQMHPSISLPETTKDLLLLGSDGNFSGNTASDNFDSISHSKSASMNSLYQRTRQCADSNTSASCVQSDMSENTSIIQKPPDSNVDLLSVWANNLVLQLEKTFSEEFCSTSACSPLSDCSLSPNKIDQILESDNSAVLNLELLPVSESALGDESQTPASERSLKCMSCSPDSGIEQSCCEISDTVYENNLFTIKNELDEHNSDVIDHDLVTTIPPKFGDEVSTYGQDVPDCASRKPVPAFFTEKSLNGHKELYSEVSMFEIKEIPKNLQNSTEDIKLETCVTAPKNFQFKDRPVSETTCTLNDTAYTITNTQTKFTNFEGCYSGSVNTNGGNPYISRVQLNSNRSNSCSLTYPRVSEKNLDTAMFQRSASQSAVSTVDPVNITELMDWMKNMQWGSPFRSKIAMENQDAMTQTTPVPLSRSSSFTWVTDCSCSDWEFNSINSGSEESFLENCANCQRDRFNENSSSSSSASSSSLGVSSDNDDYVPASSSSSLYLSACSGSSDSFEEANLIPEEIKPTVECDYMLPTYRPFRSNETILRSSTLGDIYEEQMISDTLSIKSTQSNFVFNNINFEDNQEQSASFPSTLKMTRKIKSLSSATQPVESAVLSINDLNSKSASAPVLLRQKRRLSSSKISESSSNNSSQLLNGKSPLYVCNQAPPQSAKELNELQAIEACSWLRAAGFPQYAQMYEDNLFPIDISIVQKDHAFLPPDSIQSLFRRLNTLNRCANMKLVDHSPRKSLHMEDSDEEEQYALSENWEFQCSSRRWSRISAISDGNPAVVAPDHHESTKPPSHCFAVLGRKYLSPEEAYCSSHDSVFVDEQHSSPDSIRRSTVLKQDRVSLSPPHVGDCSPGSSSGSGGALSLVSEDVHERRSLRRSGSDRVKEGARALLKRMESLKGKRKKKGRDSKKSEKVVPYSGTDGSSSSSLTSSPQFCRSQRLPNSAHDANLHNSHKKEVTSFYKDEDDANAHSDSECHMIYVLDKWKDANSNNTKHYKQFLTPQTAVTLASTSAKSNSLDNKSCVQTNVVQNQLLNPWASTNQELSQCDKRGSYYDNISAPIVVFNDFCDENFDKNSSYPYSEEKCATLDNRNSTQNEDNGEIIIMKNERRDSGVGSSLTRGIMCVHAPWHCFTSHSVSEINSFLCPVNITDLSAPQMLLLRKLSLLKLTAMMERFSPSNRTGWSWAMPKFIRRIRNPDYKDKNVFGVPLLMMLQRTGYPLPASIQAAINFLQKTALDSSGLFRKSGVRSRIQKLKFMNESDPENINYEEQQAYDIADMLKQYFRELPEALLTSKLSETFISIFQFIPEDLRLDAVQAALMLMPDENREVLQVLLEFLAEICQNASINQMTATNLAVCFAPSLFHLSSPRSASSSPRRRKTVGVPDVRELNENRAAYECLSCMISNYKTLFSVSEEIVSQSRISSAAYSQPATLEVVSSFVYDGQAGLKGFIDSCTQMFLKESKEKYKNFVTFSQYDHVEISYKKLSDSHPLRLWKVSTEVEAPPSVLLNRILRERHLWDLSFMKSKTVACLNSNTEVFQYLCSSLPPHPLCDFCVLRSWRTDLPRGACILIETSVNHPDADMHPNSVRALVLASRYLIEPCGSGKSRITHLSRLDTRGRSPEWYNRAYGHICALLLIKLRNSFSHVCTDGPETKL